MSYQHADYLKNAIPTQNRKAAVARVLRAIRKEIKNGLVFDSIAFSGMSGALVAPIVALRLNKETILIRKNGDGSHSNRDSNRVFEGYLDSRRYIIVDDFIFSGDTVKRIKRVVYGASGAKLVGVAVYNEGKREQFITRYND